MAEVAEGAGTGATHRPTVHDVARLARVAPSTVSRTLNGARGAAAGAVAQRIYEVAAEIGYRPNEAAAALRRRQSLTIGVIVPHLTDTVMATIYEEVAAACVPRGWHALVAAAGDEPDDTRTAADLLIRRGVGGLIISTTRVGDHLPQDLSADGTPVVCVLRTPQVSHTPAAVGDDVLGGYLATRHLLDLGHRRIAIIAGPQYATTARGRTDGWRRALSEAGIAPSKRLIFESSFRLEAGVEAATAILGLRPRPTAIFAVNDPIAVGALSTLSRHNLRVSQDMSVVGYNDIPLAARMPVPLTTVRVPFREIATAATDLLYEAQDGLPARQVVLAPTLLPRASSGPPGGTREATGEVDTGGSIADELAKLAALRDQGVITAADFDAGKAKLLGTS